MKVFKSHVQLKFRLDWGVVVFRACLIDCTFEIQFKQKYAMFKVWNYSVITVSDFSVFVFHFHKIRKSQISQVFSNLKAHKCIYRYYTIFAISNCSDSELTVYTSCPQ